MTTSTAPSGAAKEAPLNLVAEPLFEVDFTPMSSPAFLAKHPRVKDPEGILEVPRITPND